ncbi:alcohol dehydrogenase [Podospora fimiseda]|uniref:Alcohol dehydrogenase n=1 Tax=Podospora fimiseda TaxID=252190 RepID=A0AAN7BPW0_9PEZI|nr:alcohol dehydrogenase [Podospora fimiseda]
MVRSGTMKEALVRKGTKVNIVDSPIPQLPSPDHVLIRIVVSGSNPKDWKLPDIVPSEKGTNEGDDIAGIVEEVGDNVYEFKPGDRVAAFHEMRTPAGSYAEYGVAWAHTTFHIQKETSFEEAAALPLAAMTAAVGLYLRLKLPQPWSPEVPSQPEIPLIIYGASSSVGIYALQFALRSNIHPILCVAGNAKDYVEGFIDKSKGDVVIDYREGDDAVVEKLKQALKGKPPVRHVLDAVSHGSSITNIARVFAEQQDAQQSGKAKGHATFVLSGEKEGLPEGVDQSITMVGTVHKDSRDFGFVYFRYIARGLREGWFKSQRTEVVPGGLAGIEGALQNLKAGKASATKYVFRIWETEGARNGLTAV